MKIATLNTWSKKGPYEKRFSLILRELHRLQPDVICLQETFDDELPKQIKLALQYLYSYESFDAGLVTISKFPIRKSKTLKYKAVSPIDENDRRAIFTEIVTTHQSILIGNTHWPWKAEDDETRFKNAKEMVRYLKSTSLPIFLAGDFNTTSESNAIEFLIESGFHDLFSVKNPKKAGFTWNNARNPYLKTHSVVFPDRRIDLILGKSNDHSFEINRADLAFSEADESDNLASDHFGVIVEVIF